MPWIKINYDADVDHQWVEVSDELAANRDDWDDAFDVVNSSVDIEHSYDEPVAELPEGAVSSGWDKH
jgi:hypothetical protein